MSTNPPNHNKLWDGVEQAQLREMWDASTPLEDMARTMGRTASSIVAQLNKMGLVHYSQRADAFYISQPIYTMSQVRAIDRAIKNPEPMEPS